MVNVNLTGNKKTVSIDRKITESEMRHQMRTSKQRAQNPLEVDKEGVITEFTLKLVGLGISVIDNTPKELMYLVLDNLIFVYRESIKADDSGLLEKFTDHEL